MYKNGFGVLAMLEEARQCLAMQYIEAERCESWCQMLTQLQQEVLQEYLLRRGWVEEVPDELPPGDQNRGQIAHFDADDEEDEDV